MEVEGCELPEDRRYDMEHDLWYRPLENGPLAEVGILSSLASFAGKFTSVSFRPVEGPMAAGRSVATIESVRFTGAVRLPVDAVVMERNQALLARPKLLNDSPYDRGWVVRIRPTSATGPPPQLETADAVSERLRARILELGVHCYPAAPDVELFEIGAECAAILARLDEELEARAPEDIVLLVTDDPTSPIEMVRWEDRSGHSVLMHRQDRTLHQFLVRKEASPHPRRRPG